MDSYPRFLNLSNVIVVPIILTVFLLLMLAFFGKTPAKELQIISKTLKRQGKLCVFYQAAFEINLTAAEPIKKKLIDNSYDVNKII